MYNIAVVTDEKCVAKKGCRLCIMYCPEADCILLDTQKMVARVVMDVCKGCELCKVVCDAAKHQAELEAAFPHERIAASLDTLSTKAAAGDMTRVDLDFNQPVKALLQAAAASTEVPLHAVTVTVSGSTVAVSCGRADSDVRIELEAKVQGANRECRINAQYLIATVERGFPLYFGDKCVYTADDARRFEHAVMFFAA